MIVTSAQIRKSNADPAWFSEAYAKLFNFRFDSIGWTKFTIT